MILLLKLIIITTIWCLGFKILTERGMLLQKLGEYGKRKVDEGYIIYDPLIVCEFCLPSIHSLIGYGFAVAIGVISKFEFNLVYMYPLVAMGTSISCGFIWNGYLTMNRIKERNEFQTEYYDHLCEEQELVNEYQNHN